MKIQKNQEVKVKKKRRKKNDIDEDISEEEKKEQQQGGNYSDEIIRKMLKNKKLEKMTVPELKDICKIRNIATKGLKKIDILEKINNYLKEK